MADLLRPRATQGLALLEGGVPLLTADATVSEQHRTSATVTQHPREQGTAIADHMQPRLPEFNAQLVFSATPLIGEAVAGRPETAYDVLRQLQTERRLVTLVTSLRVYEDCALVEMSAPRSAQQGQSIVIDTTWRVVHTVSTQTATIPPEILRGMVRASGQSKPKTKDEVGTPSAATTAAAQQTKAKSVIMGLANAAGFL